MKYMLILLFVASSAFAQSNIMTLTNNQGVVFKNIKIIRTNVEGLTYLLPGGAGGGTLKFTNLPAAIQEQFHFDPIKAVHVASDRRLADAKDALARAQGAKALIKSNRDALIRGEVYKKGWREQVSVLQVLKTGLLVSTSVYVTGDHFIYFLEDYPGSVVDGEYISPQMYHMGTYTYSTVQGSEKTVMHLTCSPERAVQYEIHQADLRDP